MLFLYITEFLAESNEENYFLFKADTVSPGFFFLRNGLEKLSTEILGMDCSILA